MHHSTILTQLLKLVPRHEFDAAGLRAFKVGARESWPG